MKTKTSRHPILLTMLAALVLAGCANDAESVTESDSPGVVDDAGRRVVPAVTVERVVACSPDAAEVVAALDPALLVGRSSFADYPPEIANLPVVGGFSNPEVELIAALEPDLVLIAGLEQAPLIAKLETLGLTVYVHQPADLAALADGYRRLGILLESEDAAERLAVELESAMRDAATNPPTDPPRVYVEVCAEPLMAACVGSLQNDLLRAIGGRNVFANLPRSYHRVEPESVLAAEPEIVILLDGYTTSADAAARAGWSELPAVRAGRVYALNPDIFTRAGPRIVEALSILYGIIEAETR